MMIWYASRVVCDTLVTGTMAYQLWFERTRSFDSSIRSYLAIETGGLTCGVVMVELLLFFQSGSSYCFTLMMIRGKVYSNSLSAFINSRAPLSRRGDPADQEVSSFGDVNSANRKPTSAWSTQVESCAGIRATDGGVNVYTAQQRDIVDAEV
ncbi:hypothetical protein FPV67DRAFT_583014 [Lyophyllum atratum]|nr:hypothetical protein FPV67DRAFT_583014 [Lyophyllum atratum]